MAAVAGKPRQLGHDIEMIPLAQIGTSYSKYVCVMQIDALFKRTAVVIGTTGTGAVIGAVAGSTAGGMGTIPGAGIGAGVGFIVGLTVVNVYDYVKYRKYKASLNEEARQALDNKLNEYVEGDDGICPITGCIPLVPVRIKGEQQLYERSALEEVQRRQKVSPITRKKFKMSDIEFAVDGLARSNKVCARVLQNPQERAKFEQDELKGIKILRDECGAVADDFFKQEAAALLSKTRRKEMSPRAFAKKASELADILDPVLNEEARAARKVDREDSKEDESLEPDIWRR